MPILKSKQVSCLILLLASTAYFSTTSGWEMNYFCKSLIFMIPVQVASVIYITYYRWNRTLSVKQLRSDR
ncbi:hypothetical protein VB713_13770 [Anabaena cylindrica UHCC 0172]|nr:hypothetical protein [Anabaena cylindrica UHCC 0172]